MPSSPTNSLFRGKPPIEDGTIIQSRPLNPQGQDAFNDLVAQLPGSRPLPGGFRSIPVANNEKISTGKSAWYKFQEINVPAEMGECAIFGADFRLMPTDSTASGNAAANVGWGDASGTSAWVVIDTGLGLPYQKWVGADAHLPGIETAAGSPGLLLGKGARGYLFAEPFPSGTFVDTTPGKAGVITRIAPFVVRVRAPMTIDMALVVPNSQIHNLGGGARTLLGMVYCRAWVAPIDQEIRFTRSG